MYFYRKGCVLYSWQNKAWQLVSSDTILGLANHYVKGALQLCAVYTHRNGDKQLFQLVESCGRYGGFHYVGVDISGFYIDDNYHSIGSGAPIGAFLRELGWSDHFPEYHALSGGTNLPENLTYAGDENSYEVCRCSLYRSRDEPCSLHPIQKRDVCTCTAKTLFNQGCSC